MQIFLDEAHLIEKYKNDYKIESCTFNFSDDFDYSELFIDDIMSPDWPEAVDPLSIVQTDEDKLIRAEAILELYVKDNLSGLKFLDFGCGSGEVAEVAANSASLSVGYDIVKDAAWDNHKKSKLTTDWEEVKKLGPYDIILCYDVFDHILSLDSMVLMTGINELKKIKEICKNKVFIRFHPWSSPHGGHLYKSLNKSHAHLFLTEKYMENKSYEYLKTIKIMRPNYTYENWVLGSGFKIIEKNITVLGNGINLSKKMMDFLNKIYIKYHVFDKQLGKLKEDLKIDFVDYVLSVF